MKTLLVLLVAATAFLSCKKTTSLPEYNFDPVVTAYLTPGVRFSLQLNHQESTSSTKYEAPDLDSLDITITSDDTVYHLLPNGNGLYTDSSLVVTSGKKYDLLFAYNGKSVSATTTVPEKPGSYKQSETEIKVEQITSSSSTPAFPSAQADPVTLTWNNYDASYYIVVIQNMETAPEKTNLTLTNDTSLVFRNKPTTSNTYDINTMSFIYYGKHRMVLYHVNPDYASLYDNSTSNSQNLSTPSTGITNGVGIFTGINADTLYLQVDKK